MCGIVGAIVNFHNGFNNSAESLFYELLFADTVRGDDSTGMIFIENDSSFGIMKDAYPAPYVIPEFEKSDMGKRVISKGKALIGHNRKATVGSVNNATAHPFVVGDSFAMVHNGTLRNHKDLADTVVDSEALAIHLSKVLVEDFDKLKFEEEIGKVNGAFAIAAYNQDCHKIFLTRNHERPLSYISTPLGVFFASEANMLVWVCARNGIDMTKSEIHAVKTHELVTIDLDTNKVTTLEYTPKKATPVITTVVTGKGMVVTGAGAKSKSLSKSQYKYMRSHWMGKRIPFYVDDYIEKDFPKTVAEGAYVVNLMGESDEFSCDHDVYGTFDLTDIPTGSHKFVDCMYTGVISEMGYNKITGNITFTVDQVRQVPSPILSITYENQPTVH